MNAGGLRNGELETVLGLRSLGWGLEALEGSW